MGDGDPEVDLPSASPSVAAAPLPHEEGCVLDSATTLNSSDSSCVLPSLSASSSGVLKRPSSSSRAKSLTTRQEGKSTEVVKEAVADFRRKTSERVAAHCKLAQKKREDKIAKPRKYAHVDVDEFMKWTKSQVLERQFAAFRMQPGERPARVAVVGAGPVGLWVSILMAREHAHLVDTFGGAAPRITRPPSAPTIDLFEQRAPASFGSRRIVLAISGTTQDLLNKNLLSARSITSTHAFSPTCSINYIEDALRENFDQYAAANYGKLHFDVEIPDPDTLFDQGYDVVIWAGGRYSLDDTWRHARGLDVSTTSSEDTLVIKFDSKFGSTRNHSLEQSSLARFGKVFVRPGASDDEGWIWVLGLSSEFASQARRKLKLASRSPLTCFKELHDLLGDICDPISSSAGEAAAASGNDDEPASPKTFKTSDWLFQLMKQLDIMLHPTSIVPRVTTAAYWRSAEVVHPVNDEEGNPRAWLVLAGDAACGKPFHLGTNLNGHFSDTVALIRGTSWLRWDPAGQPFRRYVERFRVRTGTGGFLRG